MVIYGILHAEVSIPNLAPKILKPHLQIRVIPDPEKTYSGPAFCLKSFLYKKVI